MGTNGATKRAAIYARVSTDKQRGNYKYSVPTQIAECLAYAEDRGFTPVGNQYVDLETGEDVAGSNGHVPAFVDDYTSLELSRPSLDAAVTFLELVGFDVLIVFSLDRLARDPYVRRTLELELEQRGAAVEYVMGDYDETPEGEVRKDLDATFAKWENAKRIERSMRGKRGKAKRGLFVNGRPPYGYEIDREALGVLAVVEEQARVVRRIFHLYVNEGRSIREIARILTDGPERTHSGNDKWGKSTVQKILKNTTYAGRNYYNKWTRKGNDLVKRDKEKWIEIETTPIVDEAIFEEAQRRRKANKKRRRRPKRFYLLGGLIECEDCGKSYAGQTKKPTKKNRLAEEKQSYRHRAKEGHCRNRHIAASRIEPAVWAEIRQLLIEPETLREGYEQSLDQQKSQTARQRAHLKRLHEEKQKLEEQRNNLTTAYVDPDIGLTKDEYVAQRTRIEDLVKGIDGEIEEIERQLAEIPTPAELETLEQFAGEIRETLQDEDVEWTPKEKRRIYELLHVKAIIGEGDEFRIEGWFASRSASLLDTTSSCCGQKTVTFCLEARLL